MQLLGELYKSYSHDVFSQVAEIKGTVPSLPDKVGNFNEFGQSALRLEQQVARCKEVWGKFSSSFSY